jgi:hypothetical protein
MSNLQAATNQPSNSTNSTNCYEQVVVPEANVGDCPFWQLSSQSGCAVAFSSYSCIIIDQPKVVVEGESPIRPFLSSLILLLRRTQ